MLGNIVRSRQPAPFKPSDATNTNQHSDISYATFGDGATAALSGGLGQHMGDPAAMTAGGFDVRFPGGHLGESSTLSLAAAWRCLTILMHGISSLDLFAYDGRPNASNDRIAPNPDVLKQPWLYVQPSDWKAQAMASLVLHGNLYAFKTDLDPRTLHPRQLPLIHPDYVKVRLVDGVPEYRIEDDDQKYSMDEILHIRGVTMPGDIAGVGVIEAHRRNLGEALTIAEYGEGNFRESAVPPVLIRVDRPEISNEQATDVQARWMMAHAGNSRRPAVLSSAMSVEKMGFSAEDTEYLKSRQNSALEICWSFGIDPRLLSLSAGGSTLTYANIESAYTDLQRMSIQPWATRLEEGLSSILPRNQEARFDFAPLMRPTLEARYTAYRTALEAGFLTIDEVRRKENMGDLQADSAPKVSDAEIEKLLAAAESEGNTNE